MTRRLLTHPSTPDDADAPAAPDLPRRAVENAVCRDDDDPARRDLALWSITRWTVS